MNNFPDDDIQDNVMGLNADEQKKLISQALKTLNELDRVLVELFYLHEKSVEEITNITGLTNSNVKVKLHRIRKRLYGEMDKILKREMVGI
jgi:RNA polymerase sigma-70 factor (ECF subfamily)